MTLVYVSSLAANANVAFHRSSNCVVLKGGMKNRRAQVGSDAPMTVHEIELGEMTAHKTPCASCYPDAPRAKVVRERCSICSPGRLFPCIHNGGVLVELKSTGRWVHDPDQGRVWDNDYKMTKRKYVWPENAHRYHLVEIEEAM